MDFSRFTHLTFDCYGTLIDWEAGILGALEPLLERKGVTATPEEILPLYTRFEAEEEAGEYRPYRLVLERVSARIASALGAALTPEEQRILPNSVGAWPLFPDTVVALKRLAERYRLVILSNIDDSLFRETQKWLGVRFEEVITAEQVQSYKPRKAHFEAVLRRLEAPKEQVLHVAQSLYHDHVPAKEMGFATVWVNRPSRLPGTGLSLPAAARPDWEVPDLKTLADMLERQSPA